jgi:hypothetical protein
MHDRYREPDSTNDSRESRGGPIDSCDGRANPMVSVLMVSAAVVVIILAGIL